MFVEKLKKVLKKIQTFFKTLFKKHIRYQKIVTTFLYAFMFGVIIYTFWGLVLHLKNEGIVHVHRNMFDK